jgi:hypothetical protein
MPLSCFWNIANPYSLSYNLAAKNFVVWCL